MAKQRLGDKKLARINHLTGMEYRSAWYRGGYGRLVECWLAPTGDLANVDMVNRDTGEVTPKVRDGHLCPVAYGESA